MRLVWSYFAIEDREALFDHIAVDNARAAARIDTSIEKQLQILTQLPEIGRPGRVEGTRELVIDRTPFIAVYQLEGELVRILRILHGSQLWPPVS